MADQERETEVRKIGGKARGKTPPRDPSLTGGERAETPEEKERARREKEKPKEAPIIQSDVT